LAEEHPWEQGKSRRRRNREDEDFENRSGPIIDCLLRVVPKLGPINTTQQKQHWKLNLGLPRVIDRPPLPDDVDAGGERQGNFIV